MERRDFLRSAASAAALSLISRASPLLAATAARDGAARRRVFELTYEVDLLGDAGPAHLWLPLPQSAPGYQEALTTEWSGNAAEATLTQEPAYDARIFRAAWPATDAPRRVRVSTRVATLERRVDLSAATRAAPDPAAAFYLRPTASMPRDGIVRTTARQVTRGARTPVDKARAIYEWVVDNTFRDPAVLGCGTGDIKYMLASRHFGGKCADINSLFVGLARAADIPAREVYGIRVADSAQFKSLGKSGDVSKAQHCRAEFYAEPWGWIPVDPADVRKVVLEDGVPLTDARVRALRGRLFGYWEMNWVGFNSARDFRLDPSAAPVPFLMYPNARTPRRYADGLVPDKFRYRIGARELAA